jgi:predicted solute-binding protein
MTFPVAMIPYTNMAPYRELGPPAGCRFLPLVPSRSIEALRDNAVIAAAVPVGGLPALAGLTDFLGNFGIAAREQSMSVIFFSSVPLNEMGARNRIHVTGESASSVRLLYLLLAYQRGVDDLPRLAAADEPADGELLIGDRALQRMMAHRTSRGGSRLRGEFAHATDLASAWFARNKLPFVFARWVVRRDAPAEAHAALESWLSEFKAREQELAGRAAPKAAAELGLDPQTVLAYFRVIRRCLDETDSAGQELFLAECQRYGLTGASASPFTATNFQGS